MDGWMDHGWWGSSKCDSDVKRSLRGGWEWEGRAKNLQFVVVSFATGVASSAIVRAKSLPSPPPQLRCFDSKGRRRRRRRPPHCYNGRV